MREHVDLYQFLRGQLRSQEQLLWWGSPDSLYIKYHRPFVYPVPRRYRGLSLGVLLALGAVGQIVAATFLPYWMVTLFWMQVCCFLVGVCIWSVRESYQTRLRLKQTAYAVTDQRAIILAPGRRMFTLISFAPEDLGHIDSSEYADDWGHVIFGPQHNRRWHFLPRSRSRLGFRGVPCVRRITQLLLELQAQQQSEEEVKDSNGSFT